MSTIIIVYVLFCHRPIAVKIVLFQSNIRTFLSCLIDSISFSHAPSVSQRHFFLHWLSCFDKDFGAFSCQKVFYFVSLQCNVCQQKGTIIYLLLNLTGRIWELKWCLLFVRISKEKLKLNNVNLVIFLYRTVFLLLCSLLAACYLVLSKYFT